jgi:hypothetical protein
LQGFVCRFFLGLVVVLTASGKEQDKPKYFNDPHIYFNIECKRKAFYFLLQYLEITTTKIITIR